MLSKDYRLRVTEIACKVKLGRETSLAERIWMNKLCEHNAQAKELAGALLCPDFYEVE